MRNKLPFVRVFSKKHPALTVACSVLLLVASVIIISQARFDTDITRLIPQNAEKTALYFKLMEKAGGMEKAYIVFSSDHITDHVAAIEKIGREILASGLVNNVQWKIPEETKTFLKNVYAKKAPLLLSENEMTEFMHKLTPEGMASEISKTRLRMALPGYQEILVKIDPLNFFELYSSHMKFSDVSFDFRSGYFITPEGRRIIMILSPKKSPRDIAFSRQFITTCEGILQANQEADFRSDITGSHAITLHEASAMKAEIISNILVSFISVILIFLLFFRSLKGMLYVMLPVSTSVMTTLGTMIAVTGSLSEVTGAFAGLIAGMGIDLGIILYVRYLVNLESIADRTQCMDKSIAGVYRGITTGVLTTALTFFPMVFSSFRGIRELGVLTGTGMLLCWAFLFMLSSLLIKPASGRSAGIKAIPAIAAFAYKRPLAVIVPAGMVTLLLLFFVPRIQVTGDITKLGTKDNHARKILEELKETYIKEQGVFITGVSGDLESALASSLEIRESQGNSLTDLFAAGDVLPPAARQEKNLWMISSLNSGKIIEEFYKQVAAAGFKKESFQIFTEGLRKMLDNRERLMLQDLSPVKDMLSRVLIPEGSGWRVIVRGNIKDNAPLTSLKGLSFTGPLFVRQELLALLKKDAVVISVLGLLLVNMVLYLDFRNLYYVLLCQVPVFASILWTLGIMGLCNISLNFMNAVVFVMLTGIGSDYNIYLLHRYLSDRDVGSTFTQTGKAVFVAGLTAIAGFGTIGFSSYQGLASMGQVAALGTTFCVFFSFTVVPALLKLHEKNSGGK